MRANTYTPTRPPFPALHVSVDRLEVYHKGIVVGVDMAIVGKLCGYDEQTKKYVFIKKVKYQDNLSKMDSDDIKPTDSIRFQTAINNFLSTKTTRWCYENEYRLILREGCIPPDNHHIAVRLKNLIHSVYIGAEFNGDLNEILDLAKTRKFKVCKVKLISDTSEIELEELYNPSIN